MAFTVFIYKENEVIGQKSFGNLHEAFAYLGTLDFTTNVERCILDNGTKILFDLKRDKDGNLSTCACS